MRYLYTAMLILVYGMQGFSQQGGSLPTMINMPTMINQPTVLNKNPATLFDPTPYAFSHSTSAQTSGKYVFISGQSGGEDLKHTLSKDFRTQVKFALKNLETVLDAYSLNVGDVMKITILVVNHDQEKLKIWTEEMQQVWKGRGYPASTLIPVPRLALDGMMIEVDAVAFIKDADK